ncbi:MAG: hypothetical protein WAN47_11035 [Nitrosotalea sp.]
MKWLLVISILAVLCGPVAYGQLYPIQTGTAGANATNSEFPIIAYTPDGQYEADMSWEPHHMVTDKKIMFIFQFYTGQTGAITPMVDYQFVISQDGKELARISGTTTQAGDYKYFAFDHAGPVTISLEKIADKNLAVSYDTNVYENPQPSGPVNIVQPPQNISSNERAVFPILEDAMAGIIIAFLVWMAFRHKIMKYV